MAKKKIILITTFSLAALFSATWYFKPGGAIAFEGPLPSWGDTPQTPNAPKTTAGMARIPGGRYRIGDNSKHPRADAPIFDLTLDCFEIDRCEVTNRQFSEFTTATHYTTNAEKSGGGWVYIAGTKDWQFKQGASWRHPLGPDSSIENAMNHPVVLVSWEDAQNFATWAGKRLPTEAEWEVAARAGTFEESLGCPTLDASANVWQGTWPALNLLTDNYFYTAPVASYEPNADGIYDMLGNVWEWTADWYTDDNDLRKSLVKNPCVTKVSKKRVARGGSWFCSSNYCGAYTPSFRGKSPPGSAFNNVGFRCARSPDI